MNKKVLKSTCAALAAVVMVSGFWYGSQEPADTTVPQLVSYVDSLDAENGIITIEGEEVPLSAKPVVKTKTSTKTTTKRTKLKKKSKKTSKKTTRKTKKSSSVKVTGTQKIATATTTLTTATTSLKKNSKVKTVKTVVKTTVTTTTTNIASSANNATSGTTASKPAATTTAATTASKSTVAIRSIAPKAHSNVLSAYEKLNFTVTVDSTVSYSGKFDARSQSIIVRKNSDEAIYHELGHFVAFMAGNADRTSEFQKIYASEKSKFSATRGNGDYVTSSAEEYFAESYQDYVENPTGLQSARPQTYAYIVNAVSKVTDAKVSQLKQLYASIWK